LNVDPIFRVTTSQQRLKFAATQKTHKNICSIQVNGLIFNGKCFST